MSRQKSVERLKGLQAFSLGQAAHIMGMGRCSVQALVTGGRLESYSMPASNHQRIPRGVLLQFMRLNQIPVDAAIFPEAVET